MGQSTGPEASAGATIALGQFGVLVQPSGHNASNASHERHLTGISPPSFAHANAGDDPSSRDEADECSPVRKPSQLRSCAPARPEDGPQPKRDSRRSKAARPSDLPDASDSRRGAWRENRARDRVAGRSGGPAALRDVRQRDQPAAVGLLEVNRAAAVERPEPGDVLVNRIVVSAEPAATFEVNSSHLTLLMAWWPWLACSLLQVGR